jgi:Lar family restriction alleviation protein
MTNDKHCELLPCPFCGGEAEFEREGTNRRSCIVRCRNCGARHESSDEGKRSGGSWNTRAAPPSLGTPAALVPRSSIEPREARRQAIIDCAQMVNGRLAGRQEGSELWLEIIKITNMLERFAKSEHRATPSAIGQPSNEVAGLRSALGQAVQLASVAGDWNLDEVEIDGVMVPTNALWRAWRDLLEGGNTDGGNANG